MNKKKIERLKKRFYDEVSQPDETALQMLQEAATAYSSPSPTDIIDELNPAQQQLLKESIQQANQGKTISNDEVKKKSKEWLSR